MNMEQGQNISSEVVVAVSTGPSAGGPYRATVLRREDGGVTLLEYRTADEGVSLSSFLSELRSRHRSGEAPGGPRVVVAVDSTAVAFYRLELPVVGPEQLAGLVRMQAEALLPLGLDEMAMAWYAEPAGPDRQICTVAAVRKHVLGDLASRAGASGPSVVVPDCQALAHAWRVCFGGDRDKAALLHVREGDTRLILTEGGRLTQAATIDVGSGDLEGPEASGTSAELFVHDVRNALGRLDSDAMATGRVFLLAAAPSSHGSLVAYLERAGVSVRHAVPRTNGLRVAGGPDDAEALFPYAEAIGAGLLVLDDDPGLLNLIKPEPAAAGGGLTRALVRMGLALVAAVAMLGVWVFVAKSLDRAELERLKNSKLGALVAHYQTREQVYEERPDILDVLTKIKESTPDGMLVDSFVFQKGRPIQISLSARSREQVFQFEEKLASQSGISDVQILGSTLNTSTNQVQSKVTFHYLRYTRGK